MHSGGCLCGAVRYQASADPIVTRACWCRLCQYIGAGSATVNACFPADAMAVTGELSDYVSQADSGARMHRQFCPQCGVHVFSSAETRPHLIFARVGTLDDPEITSPAMTIWTSQAPRWACISQDIPNVECQPPPAS